MQIRAYALFYGFTGVGTGCMRNPAVGMFQIAVVEKSVPPVCLGVDPAGMWVRICTDDASGLELRYFRPTGRSESIWRGANDEDHRC